MTLEARSKHMSKIFNDGSYHNSNVLISWLPKVMPTTSTSLTEPVTASVSLSVSVDSFVHNVLIPVPVFHGIWNKATELINTQQNIVPAPGCSPNSKMVKSNLGTRPHLVTAGKGNKFSCDGDCVNFKAFGICSHVVTVASINQMLPAFLDMFQKQKLSNLTN